MIRVELPLPLRTLAGIPGDVDLEVGERATMRGVLDALEARYPVLRGTLRDPQTLRRRPFIRFYACREDWSHASVDATLPPAIARGEETLLIIGAIVGG